ncbi:CBF/Mak21 family-domain-containing protein [Parachaetomium inaequale]|uniref:CBF/Mak21 family-domain-containing protein n=1 Tax=Parachaetomium inaequale TaxID=2588326 RepID=A0AAN6PSP2_9PEZI|nr:CBF/Mak21 family-domain-containing protein [Parachaetomium inaequale]
MGAKRAKERKKADKPSFDETALAQLTSKIDKSLADSEKERTPKRKRQRDNDDEHDSKRRQTRPSEPNSQGDLGSRRQNKQASTLLDEILALGGNEDDLDLVANVDSGDEGGEAPRPKVSSEPIADKSLRDELAQFASTLGFSKIRKNEDPETDEESDPVEETSNNSVGEESEAEEEGNKPAPQPQEARQGKQSGNKQHLASISNLKAYAEKLLEEDSSSYLAKRASSSSQKFMSTIMSSGTLSDKVSALTLSIQESPLHNRKGFESLISLAGKRSRGQAIAALGALVDLLGNGTVLPGDRRLYSFNAQPALLGAVDEQGGPPWTEGHKLPGKLTGPHLMMWAYEDWVKGAYFRIIQLLEIWCSDEIEYSRSRALDFVFGLLKNKPEQEANLLRLVVNKLGDRERKIASRASYLLLQLLNIHPGMKAIVIGTVEQELLLKPGQSLRTKYTAINTLNQTILSTKEPAVADTLLRIYFDIFLSLLKTGSLGEFEAHDGDKKTGRSRKKPKKKGAPSTAAPGNEQETAQKLVSSLLTGVNRAIPFATAEDSTLEKHLDTLFRITHSSNFNTSVQALMLIQQLATSKQLAVDRFYRTLYESLLDPRLITSSKHTMYLNLLFRAMKNDVDVRRVKAFVKRLIQVLSLHQPSFACGILFMVAELRATFPDLHTLLDEPEDNDDDGDEVYRDVREDDPQADATSRGPPETGSQHVATYDGRKRNPEHSNAHRSCLWELVPFLTHYHPSVCVFAGNLLARQKALPRPDLASHTLMHFLDKFVYRNPKAEESKRGGSIMQPILASGSASHVVASSKATARQQPIVNSSSFWNLKPDQVSAEDVFFHEYFARVGKPGQASRAKKLAGEGQVVSDDEAAEEEEIWDALVNSQPEIEGADAEEDSDMDLEEYDYSDNDMEVDGLDADDKMSDSEGDAGFEGIFDDSEESDEAGASETEAEAEAEDDVEVETAEEPFKQGRKGRLNRKEMRSLPTFASADDYAEMLAAEDDLDD